MKFIRRILAISLIVAVILTVTNTGIVALAATEEHVDICTNAELSAVGESVVIMGDVDISGKVNVKDATAIQKFLAVMIELSDVQLFAADTDENGKVNIRDATGVQKWCAKILTDSIIGTNQYIDVESTTVPTTVPETLPVLGDDEYYITYNLSNNDSYLAGIDIENTNPLYCSSDKGLKLSNIHVDGYVFEGWYDGEGTSAVQVKEIAKGTTGAVELYAHWTKTVYEVSFASDMFPVDSIQYTVDQEVALAKPTIDKYTFVGWSDKDGNLWSKIPVGTTGNFILYANWSSNRNKATAVDELAEPIILEDSNNGVILFTYEIGTIENVPLFTTLNLNCVNGIISTHSQTNEKSISNTNAKTIAQSISNATTNSSSWTLSNNWNKTTEVSQKYLDQTSQTREEAETLSKSHSDTYNLGISQGGSVTNAITDTGSYKLSKNRSHSETTTTEKGQSFNLSVDNKYSTEAELGAEAKLGIDDLSLGAKAGLKAGYELNTGVDYGNYVKHTTSGTDSWSETAEMSREVSKSKTASKTWNTEEGFSSSNSTSVSTSVSNAISKLISQEYGYGESYAQGGSNSSAQELSTVDTKNNEFSTTMTYYTSDMVITKTEFNSTGNTTGDYRMVMAGKVHVFAVVGYDVAESAYFVYTYNVLDDETSEYLDYSYDGSFNDYENSIIPFEVPIFVNDYVNNRIAITEGLRVDLDTGVIDKYTPVSGEAATVFSVPSYITVDNGDGTSRAVKVTGFTEDLFKGNKDVAGVILGHHITEIPDNAFEGCTSLKYVICPGVKSIGDNAFSGCTALEKFTVSSDISNVGTNAFAGVPEIAVVAANADVAQNVANAGADSIVLDISSIPAEKSENMIFNIGNVKSFELQGKDKEYKNLSVNSEADKTILNGINFVDCAKIPMVLSSSDVTLNRIVAKSSGTSLLLKAENTDVHVNGTISLTSGSGNAFVCKDVNILPVSATVVGKIAVTSPGKTLVCGEIKGREYLDCATIEYISEEQFNQYQSGMFNIILNANGGTLADSVITAYYGVAVGQLPIPYRMDCNFDGWYTEDGVRYTEETIYDNLGDITLKAHWSSDWVLASDLPSDAQQTESKWTYNEKSYLTTTDSTLSGYTLIDSYWEKTGSGSVNYASFPGGFDTNNGIYTGFAKSAYSAYENENNKREVSNSWAGYVYWHWMYDCGGAGAGNRAIYNQYGKGPTNGYLYKYFGAFTSSTSYTPMNGYCNNLGLTTYYNTGRTSYADSQGSKYWFRFDYYNSTYTDYVKYYRYYTVDAKETNIEVTPTEDVFDVQKWVKYVVN